MISNPRLSLKMLVSAIVIILISCISISVAIAEPTSPSPETAPPQPTPEEPQQTSYVGFGGVIGIQGDTTSLAQGTFSVFSKHVLTNNLAIHTASTVFGSLTPSASAALTFNKPISSDSLPIVFIPFIGAGVMADFENGTRISPHLTGGIDIGTPTNVSATLRINAGFVKDRKADVGVLFGLGFSY
jgi:hypothetical protein